MTDRTDFVGLYRELGVEAGCTPEALQLAYRRRVAELHPDRAGGGADSEEQLKALNLGYDAALEFQRIHGRLPGAVPEAPSRGSVAGSPPRATYASVQVDAEAGAHGGRGWRVVLLLLVVLAAVVWWWSLSGDADAPDPAGNELLPPPPTSSGGAGLLDVGVSPAKVLALHGQPVSREQDGRRWLYGPSWIGFHCGQVIDWYSSPLRPLKASGARPSEQARTLAARLASRPCLDSDALYRAQ